MGKAKVDPDLDVIFDNAVDAHGFVRLLRFIHPETNSEVLPYQDAMYRVDISDCFGLVKDFFPPESLAGNWVEMDLESFNK